ncbi:putative Xaa-Pro aminopeptidase Fra1p [[Candida] anglica]|uniref:Xaa-Pro aminopeptidase Fra1p n=1 Tax=[Candida] anglica TaxID=148631 RepID=A0ABP0E983_9ASCO
MSYPSEKEALRRSHRASAAAELAWKNETSTISCPSFSTLLSSFRLPGINYLELDSDSEDSEDELKASASPLPDLPYVINPVTLKGSNSSGGLDMTAAEKLSKLRLLMKNHGISVYIVPSEDEHQSEYTALADRRREFISGFTGSAGIAIVTLDDGDSLVGEAALSTDGRYFLQAEKELDSRYWRLLKQGSAGYPTWRQYAIDKALASKFSNVISVDPRLISLATGEFFDRARTLQYQNKYQFIPLLQPNLVDEVWGPNKPSRSLEPVYHFPLKYSGEHTNDKLKRIRKVMGVTKDSNTNSHFVVTALDDVAWLFNLRSDDDIPFSPVFFSYSIVTSNSVVLYIDKVKITNDEVKQYLSTVDGLIVKDYSSFFDDLSLLKASSEDSSPLKVILPSKSTATYALVSQIPQSVAKSDARFESIVSNMKIIKNSTELFNAKIAQYKDSLAFILFSSWLENQLIGKNRKDLTEYEAACKIYDIRSKFPNFKGLSYETISSTAGNAAIIHYAPTKEDNSIIDPTTPYLIDSGAHYLEGTTDITRTYMFGKYATKNKNYSKWYTLVLKGHLAIAMAKFPPGSTSTGTILDAYARQPLWNEGLDFNHGTGHGVGAFGNVHESPLYISTTAGGANTVDLFQPGGILTDEPGYYVDGECGFRIESELEIIKCDDKLGKTRGGENFLGFGYLTKVPFCRNLIDTKYLSQVEIGWINDFHKSVSNEFGDKLLEMGDKKAYRWLVKETAPL